MIKHRIADFIAKNNLLKPEGKYLVALSGGADSVALLLLLGELGYQTEAVHCNFNLRGSESDRDETFCVSLCEQNNIPLHRIHFDTKTYAELHKVSIEMAARDLRYRYFEQLRQDIGADGICVAHHSDDQVETVLLNLIRGTGIHGLTGMAPQNGYVLRPLLCVWRSEIESWLHKRHQSFVTDSSNLTDDVMRNKIRLSVVPLLKEINPSVSDNICKTSHLLHEAEKMADSALISVEQNGDMGIKIPISQVLKSASPLYTLHSLLKDYGFMSAQIGQVVDKLGVAESGRVFNSATHHLLIDREYIFIEPKLEQKRAVRIPEPGTYVLDDNRRFRVEKFDKSDDFVLDKRADVCFLDASKVRFPLTVRTLEPGDRFVPLGMHGSKLLSDFLTDRKLTLFEKQRQLVVADASGEIVWVVNQRPNEGQKITDDTQGIIRMELV